MKHFYLNQTFEAINAEGNSVAVKLTEANQDAIFNKLQSDFLDIFFGTILDAVQENLAEDLTDDERSNLGWYLKDNYDISDNPVEHLAYSLLFENLVGTLTRKAEELIENRKKIYVVPVMVTYTFDVPVLASDSSEAVDIVGDLEYYDFDRFVSIEDIFEGGDIEVDPYCRVEEDHECYDEDDCING